MNHINLKIVNEDPYKFDDRTFILKYFNKLRVAHIFTKNDDNIDTTDDNNDINTYYIFDADTCSLSMITLINLYLGEYLGYGLFKIPYKLPPLPSKIKYIFVNFDEYKTEKFDIEMMKITDNNITTLEKLDENISCEYKNSLSIL